MVGDTYLVMESKTIAAVESYKVQIYHTKSYNVNKVIVYLHCQEVRSEGKNILYKELFNEKIFEGGKRFVKPHYPLYEFLLNIPKNVSHGSFENNCRIVWTLKLKLDLPDRPDMNPDYIIHVESGPPVYAESIINS